MSLFGLHKKIEKERQKDYERRARNFLAAFQEISKEHEIDIIPKLEYTEGGVIPIVKFKDIKNYASQNNQDSGKPVEGGNPKGN
jgi:hypothetical protein